MGNYNKSFVFYQLIYSFFNIHLIFWVGIGTCLIQNYNICWL